MRLGSLALLAVGTAAGYALARQLLAEDGIPEHLPDRVPESARAHLEGHRTRLRTWRARAKEALIEAGIARDEARAELMRQYHEATDRDA
jgi:hypothetical protein